MKSFKKILLFAIPYNQYAFLNIIFNALYALFSALSFVSLIPMLNVLFGQTPKVETKPVYKDITHLKSFVTDSINYKIGETLDVRGTVKSHRSDDNGMVTQLNRVQKIEVK